MSSTTPTIIDRLRQPEYTGENRCMPCTIVNSAIAVVLSLLVGVGLATVQSTVLGAAAGVVVLAASALSIALRGYLVPGTPTLTKRYFPDRVLAWFEKEPPTIRDETGVEADVDAETEADEDDEYERSRVDGEKVERILQEAGALEECENVDDLCLTDEFRSVWNGHIAELRDEETTRDQLAQILDVEPDELEFEDFDGAFIAKQDRRHVGKWESEAAFVADMSAARSLEEVDPEGWADLDMRERSGVLNGIRVFLEVCPTCDGVVTLGEEKVESCCREYQVTALSCDDCGARLFESGHERIQGKQQPTKA